MGEAVALAVTLLHAVLQAGAVILFPALALRTWRSHGRRDLLLVTGAAVAVVVAAALALASDAFGNRLSATHGYADIASRLLMMYMLTLGLPMVTVAAVIQVLPRGQTFVKSYLLAVAVSIGVWIAGIVMSVFLVSFRTK